MLFAVTDIETTGGSPSGNSITEVAVVLTDGVNVLDQYSTLVNPHRIIPHYITVLTGIDNSMVDNAPTFGEVAEQLMDFFKEAIFVAHNVNFDYSFLKAAFEHNGVSFNRPKLCTVRYTRKVFPGLGSYSLGAVCNHFGFRNDNPHRALNDTLMALELLKNAIAHDENQLILKEFLKRGGGDAFLPMHLNKQSYHNLPEASGVYYFRNSTGKVIYVGKAKNIKKRVRQHFSGKLNSAKKQGLVAETFEIDFILTGTELIAALKEDAEIKKLWPKHNSAQKNLKRKFGVFQYQDRLGRVRLTIQNLGVHSQPLIAFSSGFTARQFLFDFREQYDLPYYRLGLPALQSEQDLEEDIEEINELLDTAIRKYKEEQHSFVIKGKGRNQEEYSIILVKENQYKGYGFFSKHEPISSPEELEELIEHGTHSDFSMSVILHFLEAKKAGKIIRYKHSGKLE
ncbi:MAG: exonuclease domain-containing protein [Flavobacteriales bacterium]